eukprot:TRINITY_DN3262_c0_g1_i1.p1 TRINITY_DN3262_c0_g1~~TRINITY_DN3262_c0_g1_i1.p1  ORF type:complete len:170 (+),score=18.54 TRINITY_DN3262_c0_g1_i1:190-699(+)
MNYVEGFIVVFEDGTMYKLKSNWYIYRSKRSAECSFFEKDIWQLVLKGQVDDYADAMGPRRLESIGQFGLALFQAISESAAIISAEVEEAKSKGMDKRQFVQYIRETRAEASLLYSEHQALFFSVFDSGSETAYQTLLDYVLKNSTSTPKIDAIRHSICKGLSISFNGE